MRTALVLKLRGSESETMRFHAAFVCYCPVQCKSCLCSLHARTYFAVIACFLSAASNRSRETLPTRCQSLMHHREDCFSESRRTRICQHVSNLSKEETEQLLLLVASCGHPTTSPGLRRLPLRLPRLEGFGRRHRPVTQPVSARFSWTLSLSSRQLNFTCELMLWA